MVSSLCNPQDYFMNSVMFIKKGVATFQQQDEVRLHPIKLFRKFFTTYSYHLLGLKCYLPSLTISYPNTHL